MTTPRRFGTDNHPFCNKKSGAANTVSKDKVKNYVCEIPTKNVENNGQCNSQVRTICCDTQYTKITCGNPHHSLRDDLRKHPQYNNRWCIKLSICANICADIADLSLVKRFELDNDSLEQLLGLINDNNCHIHNEHQHDCTAIRGCDYYEYTRPGFADMRRVTRRTMRDVIADLEEDDGELEEDELDDGDEPETDESSGESEDDAKETKSIAKIFKGMTNKERKLKRKRPVVPDDSDDEEEPPRKSARLRNKEPRRCRLLEEEPEHEIIVISSDDEDDFINDGNDLDFYSDN